MEIVIKFLNKADREAACEWLNYGELRGLGQWRNSGKGRFYWDQLDAHGAIIGGNNERGKKAARILAERKAREEAAAKRLAKKGK